MDERNLEHQRAEYAHICVSSINDPKMGKKYRSAARSAGALIQKSGLMQTFAFYLSKGEEYDLLACHCLGWLWRPQCHYLELGEAEEIQDQFADLLTKDDIILMAVTGEIAALLVWLKRFAEGMLIKDVVQGDDSDEDQGNGG